MEKIQDDIYIAWSHYMRITSSYFGNTRETKVCVWKPDFNIAILPGEKILSFCCTMDDVHVFD